MYDGIKRPAYKLTCGSLVRMVLKAAMETSSMSRLGSRVVRPCRARLGQINQRTQRDSRWFAVQRMYS